MLFNSFPFFLLVFLWGHQVFADPIEDFFQSLNSPHLKVATQLETSAIKTKTHILKNLGLTWKPKLEIPLESDNCATSSLQKAISISDGRSTIKQWWQRCEPSWRLDSFNFVTHSEAILRTDFEPTQHPAARIVTLTIANGIKVPGLLFLKGPVARPLVILRPGIFSSYEATVAERFLMMQLFDEGPYHLLVLPSTSSRSYIELNHHFNFGGLEEGLQTAEVLQRLQDTKEPLHRYISKIHLVGISLGGHGLWLTNFLQQVSQKKWVDKSLLLCPAVHLEAMYRSQKKYLLESLFVQNWFDRRLSPEAHRLGLKEKENISDFLERQFKNGQPPKVPWPNYVKPPFPSATNHWEWNDFWSWLPPYDFTNTFVIWTTKDPVVPPPLNVETLKVQLNARPDNFMELPRGLHCSLPTTYNWRAVSMSIRGYLDPLYLPSMNADFSKIISGVSEISSLLIRRIEVNNQSLKITLELNLKTFFPEKKMLSFEVPSTLSDHSWLLSQFDETLQESLIREFSSRLSWVQEQNNLTIKIHPLWKRPLTESPNE
ncbi:MAG: hypothetical protein RJB66_1407 [Pseudomonadota bacterium]|jgi:predicted alpha/beta-fold hydrolase